MDENHLDKRTMELICKSISEFREHIYKIAFIGLHGFTKYKFNNILVRTLEQHTISKEYFKDAELAKEWLV